MGVRWAAPHAGENDTESLKQMQNLRAGLALAGFLGLTLPLLPVQYLFVKLKLTWARTFPHWYHRQLCRILGIRMHVEGEIERHRPVLIVSNHVSWLDIPVLSAVAPLSFVAKSEVDSWPFINWLARLQRTVFVDRTRRAAVRDKALEIAERLKTGDRLVLFAEGTSSDGNRILPFKSSLFAAVSDFAGDTGSAVVQTVSLAYTHLHGIPANRHQRPLIAWYGDMEIASHAWQLLKEGPVDVKLRIGPPVSMSDFKDRKQLAAYSEAAIRRNFIELLTARPLPVPLSAAQTKDEPHAA